MENTQNVVIILGIIAALCLVLTAGEMSFLMFSTLWRIVKRRRLHSVQSRPQTRYYMERGI